MITGKENINHMMSYGTYLSGLLLNTFFENWQGQKIIHCNQKM